MKGFSEFRGHILKQEYDPNTKQFVTKAVAPLLSAASVNMVSAEKVERWRKLRAVTKTKRTAHQQIHNLPPELLDDIGMTDASVAALLL